MEIRRKLLAGAIGLALVAGTVGCGGSYDGAGDEATEAAPDGTTETTEGTVDADGDGQADLPPEWPAGFVLPETMTRDRVSSNNEEVHVRGTMDGDLETVTAEFETIVGNAGFGIYEQMTTPQDGRTTTVTRSSNAEWDVYVAVTEGGEAPEGGVVVDIEADAKRS